MVLTHNINWDQEFAGERKYLNALNNMKISGVSRTTAFFHKQAKRGKISGVREDQADEAATIVDNIIGVLNRTYGENWDFHFTPKRDYADVYFELRVIIIFPVLEITNQDDLSHTIRDLIVSFKVGFCHFTIEEIKGTRGKLEYLEWKTGYLHSHIPSNRYSGFNSVFNLSSFCTAPDINEVLMDINGNYSEELFESFLYNIQSMVEWESIEGRPHIRMNSIHVSPNDYLQPKIISPTSLAKHYENFLLKVTPEFESSLNFVFKDGKYQVKKDKALQDNIKNILKSNSAVALELIIREEEDNYIGYDTNAVITDFSVTEKFQGLNFETGVREAPYFYIQARKVEFSVDDYTGEQTIDINNYKVHPKFLNYVTTKLDKQLYKKSIRDYSIRKYHQSNNA